MKKNLGPADRVIRVLLGIALVLLFVLKTVTGVWGLVLVIAGGILLFTSLVNFCPLYAIFGISTGKVKKA